MARRNSLWLPFTSSTTVWISLAAGGVDSFGLASIAEAEVGAEFVEFTTRRLLIRLAVIRHATVDVVLGLGVKYHAEHLAVTAQQQPLSHPSADWQWHEYMPIEARDTANSQASLDRDVAISRKMRQIDEELALSIENPAGGTIQYYVSGRLLILRA